MLDNNGNRLYNDGASVFCAPIQSIIVSKITTNEQQTIVFCTEKASGGYKTS